MRNDGAQDIRVIDYFYQQEPADLLSPEGAVLRSDIVERLAGPMAPGQYAQTGQRQAEDPIGQVETTEGVAHAQRTDGTRVELDVGSKVYQDDIITTGPGGKVSITFTDGTIFSLASDSRMLLDELVYEKGGNENKATFDLIEGSFVFIAGEVAKTGDMDVNTPTATMGIRGTTVKVDLVTKLGQTTVFVSLNEDPGGGSGEIELYDHLGKFIANITSTEKMWIVSSIEGETREVDRTTEDYARDAETLNDAATAFALANGRVANGESYVDLPSSRQRDQREAPDAPLFERGPTADDDAPPDTDGGDTGPGLDTGTDSIEEESSIQEEKDTKQNVATSAQNDRVSGLEDSSIVINILSNDTGVGLTVTAATNGANGTTQTNPDGTITYTPDANFNGTDSFSYTAQDNEGVTDTANVTVTVGAVNDTPVSKEDFGTTNAGVPVTIAVLDNDSDIDGDILSVTAATNGTNGSTQINPDGTITYTPDTNFTGVDSFSYTADDGSGGSVTEFATVDVQAAIAVAGLTAPAILTGTGGNDQLQGGADADSIDALAGDDVLQGASGGDLLFGGDGNDLLQGGSGDDFLSGGGGTDTLEGGQGNDTLEFVDTFDSFDGGVDNDVLLVNSAANSGSDLFSLLKDSNLEAVDLDNSAAEALLVGLQDVVELSSTSDTKLEALLNGPLPESATIYGDSNDRVELEQDATGSWHLESTVTDGDGTTFNVYEFVDTSSDVLATLAIEDEVTVTIPTA